MAQKILILVEGLTEESFVKHVLAPHLSTFDKYLIPTIITTKKVKVGADFKGGISNYKQVKSHLARLLSDSNASLVTTMLDYYGLPSCFPGREKLAGSDALSRALHVESEFDKDINSPKFLPYLSLHEFEALLFSDTKELANTILKPGLADEFHKIRGKFHSPEDINDDPVTAPSRRILSVCPEYNKPVYGRLVAERIGLANIRKECAHFNGWISRMESLS